MERGLSSPFTYYSIIWTQVFIHLGLRSNPLYFVIQHISLPSIGHWELLSWLLCLSDIDGIYFPLTSLSLPKQPGTSLEDVRLCMS